MLRNRLVAIFSAVATTVPIEQRLALPDTLESLLVALGDHAWLGLRGSLDVVLLSAEGIARTIEKHDDPARSGLWLPFAVSGRRRCYVGCDAGTFNFGMLVEGLGLDDNDYRAGALDGWLEDVCDPRFERPALATILALDDGEAVELDEALERGRPPELLALLRSLQERVAPPWSGDEPSRALLLKDCGASLEEAGHNGVIHRDESCLACLVPIELLDALPPLEPRSVAQWDGAAQRLQWADDANACLAQFQRRARDLSQTIVYLTAPTVRYP